jgi:tRNA 2-thiouridine synthesizing protein B
MLHTVNKSPLGSSSLESALRVAAADSPILLLEDGVYAASAGARSAELALAALRSYPVYALGPDLEARGIQRIIPGIRVIGLRRVCRAGGTAFGCSLALAALEQKAGEVLEAFYATRVETPGVTITDWLEVLGVRSRS